MAKLSTSVTGNNNTRYTYVEVNTKVSTQEYSSCKQYDRKFGDHSKTSFNFVTSRSKQNPHTHAAIRTNVPTNRKIIKMKYVDQKNIFLEIHVTAVSKNCRSRTSR